MLVVILVFIHQTVKLGVKIGQQILQKCKYLKVVGFKVAF